MKDKENKIPTPSEFYRIQRPENFSDSEITNEVELPREYLEYELSKVSTNQKQDEFETLARKLAEKFISPNLIPQVGPTGGGDGKTDSETHPVSKSISTKWYFPENGWRNDEKWAFAISSKQQWKGKLKSDIKSIISTKRNYTHIFFITNQKISSKRKKDAQDEFKSEFKIEITILDGEWILEKVYSNNLISLVADSLNLSSVFKNQKTIKGKNDEERARKLELLENKIENPNRKFEYDYQLVEDALESAILSRKLENPKTEIFGRFDRAVRISKIVKNEHQLCRIYYQKAWTYLYWFDDYQNFITEFLEFKKIASQNLNINILELYFNLLNSLRTAVGNLEIENKEVFIDLKKENQNYLNLLSAIIKDKTKTTTALVADSYRCLLEITNNIKDDDLINQRLTELQEIFKDGRDYLDYPFEGFFKVCEVMGILFPNSPQYDNLIDLVAEISENRNSELTAGWTYFKRGIQKLQHKNFSDSIIYFGRTIKKVAKEESGHLFFLSLRALANSYSNLGLYWAANDCFVAATSLKAKEWYNTGKPSKDFLRSLMETLENELLIGRIPYILSWYEIYRIISPQFDEKDLLKNEIPFSNFIDHLLAVRLLNVNFNLWEQLKTLPQILDNEELWISSDVTLFLLGHTELIDENEIKEASGLESLKDYYDLIREQPFKEQLAFSTKVLNKESDLLFNTVVLGTGITIHFTEDLRLILFAETVLAFIESFLATTFLDIFPSTENILIHLSFSQSEKQFKIERQQSAFYKILITKESLNPDKIQKILLEIVANLIQHNFLVKEPKQFLERLYKKDEIHERQSIIFSHSIFFQNIFGQKPKVLINDWIPVNSFKEFPLKRTKSPFTENSKIIKSKIDRSKSSSLDHQKIKVSSIINNELWNKAKWQGFGFFV